MFYYFCWNFLFLKLLYSFSKSKSVRLWKKVWHQLIVIVYCLTLNIERCLWFCEPNKLYWNDSTLMKKLEETMLSVSSWFTKINNSCLIANLFSMNIYSFTIALHIKLLNMWSKFGQCLTIRNYSSSWVMFYCSSVKSYQTK